MHWKRDDGEETNNKLNNLIEFRFQTDVEFYVKEVERRGFRLQMLRNETDSTETRSGGERLGGYKYYSDEHDIHKNKIIKELEKNEIQVSRRHGSWNGANI